MYNEMDTIAAISTAPGDAGIAIVRCSGPQTYEIADRVFRCGGKPPSARPHQSWVYGHALDINGCILDECLLLIMRAPRSFTREEMIEIQCHGGRIISQQILRTLIQAGARSAEPGEFTRRAFLNGRIDLVQAEAILDLIHAQSQRAAAVAVEQLEGHLSNQIDAIYDHWLQAATLLETALDFVEEDIPVDIIRQVLPLLNTSHAKARGLLDHWQEGHMLREGLQLVIAGPPNAGKSTLLNALLGHDRAIVSAIPGTTRDTLIESLTIDGIPVQLIDTAGVRTTDCEIEKEGIVRTWNHAARADLILFVADGSHPVTEETVEALQRLNRDKILLIVNKMDKGDAWADQQFEGITHVRTTLSQGAGIDLILAAIKQFIESHIALDQPAHAVISERHRALICEAAAHALTAQRLIESEAEQDIMLAASSLRDALETLGRITGRVYHDELLNSIFSHFCIGK